MILEITQEDHPALRTRGRRIDKIDKSIRELATDMIDTMREAEGIGLAAQQVGLPVLLFVLDVPQMKERPSRMRVGSEEVDFEALMPMVLLNPQIETCGKAFLESEGCLSFPGLKGDVLRPLSVRVKAQTLEGTDIEFEADGLLARAVQHEFDHLHGILFIDRLAPDDRDELPPDIRRIVRPLPKA